jgi:hypothetical protein
MLLAARQQAVRLSGGRVPGACLCVRTHPWRQSASRGSPLPQAAFCLPLGIRSDPQQHWRHQHQQAGPCRQHAPIKQSLTRAAAGSAAPGPPSGQPQRESVLGAKAQSLVSPRLKHMCTAHSSSLQQPCLHLDRPTALLLPTTTPSCIAVLAWPNSVPDQQLTCWFCCCCCFWCCCCCCCWCGGAQAALGVLLVSGTANRVLYRMALVPLKDYIFFLAQCQNLMYILVYFTLLGLRYRWGGAWVGGGAGGVTRNHTRGWHEWCTWVTQTNPSSSCRPCVPPASSATHAACHRLTIAAAPTAAAAGRAR